MSWLRASRKLVDPSGVEWDIYVTRIHVPETGDLFPAVNDQPHVSMLGFAGVFVNLVVRLVVRVVVVLPFSLVRSRFGITRRIEAITEWPQPITHVWDVQGPPGKLLLDEIARGLALGTVPEPAGAVYRGTRG